MGCRVRHWREGKAPSMGFRLLEREIMVADGGFLGIR